MSWYVFALVDQPPAARPGRGLREPLAVRRVPGGFAVIERRADVPPAEFDTLRTHDAVVTRIAAAVPAILPVRFGTLLEQEEIEEALAERDEEIVEAFERVRGRVQFTWRAREVTARGAGAAAPSRKPGGRVPRGAEYLRRAAAKAGPPAAFRAVRDKLRPLVSAERYQAPTPLLPSSLYHLVGRDGVERYALVAGKLASTSPVLRVTGPFAPFAFTPELL